MADAKLSDLVALSGSDVASGDLLYIVDVSATTSGSKKITVAEFWAQLGADVADVTKYGAKGDGSTDDSDAIQAAIAAAVSSGHYRVFLPAGTYIISETLSIPSYLEFFGVGPKSIIKLADSGDATLTAHTVPEIVAGTQRSLYPMIITDQDAKTYDVYLHDFAVNGNSANLTSTATSFAGIALYDTERTRVERVYIDDCNKSLTSQNITDNYRAFCLFLAKCDACTVIGGVYGDAGYESIGIRGDATGTYIGGGLIVDKDYATAYGRHGIQVFGPTGYSAHRCTIDGVICRGRNCKIIVHGGSNVRISNCDFEGVYDVGGCMVHVLSGASDVQVSGVRIYKHATPDPQGFGGVILTGDADGVPSNCVIEHCDIDTGLACITVAGGYPVVIRDNHLTSTVRECIAVVGTTYTVKGLIIDGNSLATTGTNARKAVDIADGQQCVISNNYFKTVATSNAIELEDGDKYYIHNNDFSDVAGSVFTLTDSPTYLVENNVGYTTNAYGTGTLGAAATSVEITHGLNRWPVRAEISIEWLEDPGNVSRWWISAISGTTFTLTVDAAPGADADFAWKSVPMMR